MANTYAMHFNRFAGEYSMYDPTARALIPGHARLEPLCRIRGRKDVTADASKVTCATCLKKLAAAAK